MGFRDRMRDLKDTATRPKWDGTAGVPPSGNGASSFHLAWDAPPGRWIGAEATLEVIEKPTVERLHFWALQVSFVDTEGRSGGGAHFGLQWCTNPTKAAVNWGGYGPVGDELWGSDSSLPSAWSNPNTRNYAWRRGTPYRLRVIRGGDAPGRPDLRAWRGEVTDLHEGITTHVRDLYAAGPFLASPMVWSEVFAACDDPPSAVRWSDLRLIDERGTPSAPFTTVSVNYQALREGGCSTTTSEVDGDGFVQRTGTARTTRQGARLTSA